MRRRLQAVAVGTIAGQARLPVGPGPGGDGPLRGLEQHRQSLLDVEPADESSGRPFRARRQPQCRAGQGLRRGLVSGATSTALGMTVRRSSRPASHRAAEPAHSLGDAHRAGREPGGASGRARCHDFLRSATRMPPTTHGTGRPASGAASRAATFAWNRKLWTNAGRSRRARPPGAAPPATGGESRRPGTRPSPPPRGSARPGALRVPGPPRWGASGGGRGPWPATRVPSPPRRRRAR